MLPLCGNVFFLVILQRKEVSEGWVASLPSDQCLPLFFLVMKFLTPLYTKNVHDCIVLYYVGYRVRPNEFGWSLWTSP